MTNYDAGDIVLVHDPFTDLTLQKIIMAWLEEFLNSVALMSGLRLAFTVTNP